MDGEVVHDSPRMRVIRIPGDAEHPTLIRKELKGPGAAERCRRETALLMRLEGIPGVLGLAGPSTETSLLFRDEGNQTLRERMRAGRPPVDWLRNLAEQLARTLAAVHGRGVVHKGLNPQNILVGGDRPILTSFELGTLAAQERPGFTHQSQITGNLAFLAPEQTGRTGRAVDSRSDLYALGATLYAAATGRPPSEATDPLRLMHDVLARRPEPVAALVPGFPAVFSAIIDRLLEKEPDRRYQSAAGCAFDLAHTGDELGTHDFPSRLAAPARLIGRDDDIARLRAAFDAARAGRAGCLLVTGPSGSGKSTLVDELRPAAAAAGGWFVSGKFDRHRRDVGGDAFPQIHRALARLLLGEDDAALDRMRAVLLPALGADAGLLAAMTPEFGTLLRVAPEPAPLDRMQAQTRLFQGVLTLIREVVSTDRPLVVAADDLQWAAAVPAAFFETLMTAAVPGLFLVATYRVDEVDAPLQAQLDRWQRLASPPERVTLRNLGPDDLATLLTEVLRMPYARAAGLSAVIAPRTGGAQVAGST